jgi:hypothetical protein
MGGITAFGIINPQLCDAPSAIGFYDVPDIEIREYGRPLGYTAPILIVKYSKTLGSWR